MLSVFSDAQDMKQKKAGTGEIRIVEKPRGATHEYLESCRRDFWQEVFRLELEFLLQQLKGCREILSVGCGPAIIEDGLAQNGFMVTGLDRYQEALCCAPDSVRTVVASADDMPFPESSFDAALYVASLQFIDNYGRAIEKTASLLRPDGRLIVMLLNPESKFFRDRFRDPNSYISRLQHKDLQAIEDVIAQGFAVRTEYFLGIRDNRAFQSSIAADAALYVIVGTKQASARGEKDA